MQGNIVGATCTSSGSVGDVCFVFLKPYIDVIEIHLLLSVVSLALRPETVGNKDFWLNHPILDTRIFVLRSLFVTLVLPFLHSEMGRTRELWSNNNILKGQIICIY